MDISWYRNKVANVPKYKSFKWQLKVSKMPDAQVIALYHKFKADGLYDKKKSVKKETEKYYQYTIFDYLGGKIDG